MKLKTFIYLVIAFSMCFSCAKEEGKGGKITLTGKVKQLNISENDSVISEEYLIDEDVFIIYGEENQSADNDVKTGIDGSFKFEYLHPGNYTVYVLGDDTTGSDFSGEGVYKTDVELSKGDDIKDIGDITINNYLDYDDGFASICGRALQLNCIEYTTTIVDTTYAQYEEVFLIYNDHDTYDERVRTSFDGSFCFNNLIKGNYTIYMYSESLIGSTEMIPVKVNVNITSNFQEASIDTIFYKKVL